MLAVGEIFQDRDGVVADAREFDALLFEAGLSALQLNQLPLAVRSPVGGAKKEDHCALRAF